MNALTWDIRSSLNLNWIFFFFLTFSVVNYLLDVVNESSSLYVLSVCLFVGFVCLFVLGSLFLKIFWGGVLFLLQGVFLVLGVLFVLCWLVGFVRLFGFFLFVWGFFLGFCVRN